MPPPKDPGQAPSPPGRISHERAALTILKGLIERSGGEPFHSGQFGNTFEITEWKHQVGQHPQFGDLRIDTPTTTCVIEIESAGGVTNLAKYWPLLRQRTLTTRLVIVHLFRATTTNDYRSHRSLWTFLVERMKEDLAHVGVRWPDNWEASLLTYRHPTSEELAPVAAAVNRAIRPAGPER